MRDVYYEELRKNCSESTKFTPDQNKKLIDAVKKVLLFNEIARKDGILQLEEGCESIDKETEEMYFAELIMLVVDGTDQELVREYALNRYFAANLTEYEGIIYLLYFKGTLMIQDGKSSMIVEQILGSMLPENVRKLYMEKKREESELLKESEQEALQDKINSICKNNRKADENEHILLSEVSLFFENITDQVIQRILREVDCNELAMAMKGLSGNAIRRIFDNLSQRVAARVAEDIELMEPISIKDVNESVIKIVSVILKLEKAGEFHDDNLVVLKIVMDIYNSDKVVGNMYKERYSMLKRALDDLLGD